MGDAYIFLALTWQTVSSVLIHNAVFVNTISQDPQKAGISNFVCEEHLVDTIY